MNEIIKVLEAINQKPLKVYIGDGKIEDLSIILCNGLKSGKIESFKYPFPKQYLELLTFSNGIMFFQSGDYAIYSLEEALDYQKALEFDEWIVPIGYFLGETILLNCKESNKECYLYAGSSMLKDEFISLNLDIKGFLEKMLQMNCNCFWLDWENVKHYDFSPQ